MSTTRTRLTAALAAAVLVAAGLPSAAAAPSAADCPAAASLCLYSLPDYRGTRWALDDRGDHRDESWNDRAMSAHSNYGHAVRLYEHYDLRFGGPHGRRVCLNPGTGVPDLGRYGLARRVTVYIDSQDDRRCGDGPP